MESNLEKILREAKEQRIPELSNELDNILFLDIDGVINLDPTNHTGPFKAEEQINNLNELCLEYDFKIVVDSSWRSHSDYKDILYNSGLKYKIPIIDRTEHLDYDRETEILKYLETNHYVDLFIILDDNDFNELSKYHVKTETDKGFTKEKLEEARRLIEELKNN